MYLKSVVKKILGRGDPTDYRGYLFRDLTEILAGERLGRILEIGPKDGQDTARLLTLEPDRLVLMDLPTMETTNRAWLEKMQTDRIEYISANFMYDRCVEELEPFHCIWCTGVLYHNPEQLRMIRKLYDLLQAGGILVLESATIRRRGLREECCVEVIPRVTDEYKRKYRVSKNVNHLPSASAMRTWLEMVGFEDVRQSHCHRKQSRALGKVRAAFICRKPESSLGGNYYTLSGNAGYVIGKAL